MRLLALALFAGLALVAAAIIWASRDSSEKPDYAAYERTVRAYLASEGIESVERLHGTVFRVRLKEGCTLIDPTKQYETDEEYGFWVNWVGKAGCDT